MGNAFPTRGSTITIDGTDIKAILLEDMPIIIGEAGQNKETAIDGSVYTFVGEQGDSAFDAGVLITDDTVKALNEAVYGTGSVVGNETTFALTSPGDDTTSIIITSPVSAGSVQLRWESVNAKGLVFSKDLIKNSGFKGRIKFTCDYWNEIVVE